MFTPNQSQDTVLTTAVLDRIAEMAYRQGRSDEAAKAALNTTFTLRVVGAIGLYLAVGYAYQVAKTKIEENRRQKDMNGPNPVRPDNE